MTRLVSLTAGGVICLGLAVVASTFVGGMPVFPGWIPFPLTLAALLVTGVTVRESHRRGLRGAINPEPSRLRAVLIASMLAAWVLAVVSISALRHGGPERHGFHYYRRDHTALTPVSKQEYERLLRNEQRLFGAGALFFALGSIGAVKTRRRATPK